MILRDVGDGDGFVIPAARAVANVKNQWASRRRTLAVIKLTFYEVS